MDLKSNEPFWLVKHGIISSYPSLRNDLACDVLVVGAGITGSLIAHQCVEDGYQTVVIDKREVVNGSSAETTFMVQYEIDNPLYQLIDMVRTEGAVDSYKACCESIDKLGKLASKIKSESGFKNKLSLYYACRKHDVARLKEVYE